ncbi:MAG: hypothetical protein ACFFDF_14205, partial [Candidatus Odinarchaeota archaeon]
MTNNNKKNNKNKGLEEYKPFKTNIRQRYSSRPYKIINFCKYYRLEDNLEILSFNKRFSEPKLRWVLRKSYDYTQKFIVAIAERIINKSNIIIVIFGTPNSGKSEGAQTLAFFIRYCLWKYLGIKVKTHLAFSTADFQNILTNMEAGDIGIRDESSKLSGIGSKNVQKYLDNITRAVRQDQNSFLFVDPTIMEPDVVYYFLETAGLKSFKRCRRCGKEFMNLPRTKENCKCGGKLELLYTKCKIRFILYDKDKKELGH